MFRLRLRNKLIIVVGISFIILITVIVATLTALSSAAESLKQWVSDDTSCLGSKPYAPQKIEEMARMLFPSNVVNLEADASGIQDCTIFLSFDISPEELSNFMSSTYINADLDLGNPPLGLTNLSRTLPWSFDPQKTYLVGEGMKNREHQYIAVDIDNPYFYKVYFATFLP